MTGLVRVSTTYHEQELKTELLGSMRYRCFSSFVPIGMHVEIRLRRLESSRESTLNCTTEA